MKAMMTVDGGVQLEMLSGDSELNCGGVDVLAIYTTGTRSLLAHIGDLQII
jgi:hypothetical protein